MWSYTCLKFRESYTPPAIRIRVNIVISCLLPGKYIIHIQIHIHIHIYPRLNLCFPWPQSPALTLVQSAYSPCPSLPAPPDSVCFVPQPSPPIPLGPVFLVPLPQSACSQAMFGQDPAFLAPVLLLLLAQFASFPRPILLLPMAYFTCST